MDPIISNDTDPQDPERQASPLSSVSASNHLINRLVSLPSIVDGAVLISASEALHPKYSIRQRRAIGRLQGLGITDATIIDSEPAPDGLKKDGIELWANREGYFVGNPGKAVHESIGFKHLLALRHMVARGFERMLVCECDVLFHENFEELFPKFWEKVPAGFDVVYVGFGYPIQQFSGNLEKLPGCIWKGAFWCNHCMIVSREGAEKILSALPMHDQFDYFLGRLAFEGRLNSYGFYLEHKDLEASGRCAYVPWGLAYQEKD